MVSNVIADRLEPLPYHLEVVEHLRGDEPGLWAAFSGRDSLEGLAEATRLELLKNTVRLSPDSIAHGEVHAQAQAAAQAIGLTVPVHIYQGATATTGGQANASLYFVPDEAHVVLFGSVLEQLSSDELRALFGHELAHHHLWTRDDGCFWIADRLLDANAAHGGADPSHLLTAQRWQLSTELYADRGAAIAAGANEPAIGCLLKVQTGLADPDVEAYRQQVADVLADGPVTSTGETHPEGFIRVRSLDAWSAGVEDDIRALIEGPLHIDRLDRLGQLQVEQLTRDCLFLHLQHRWLRSTVTIGQVRLVWPEFNETAIDGDRQGLAERLRETGDGLADYWCYLLLDLAVADPELEDAGILAGQLTADQLGLRERFESIANKEVRISRKRIDELWRDREELTQRFTAEEDSA